MTDRVVPRDLPAELLQLVAHHLVPPLSHSKPFEVVHDTTYAASLSPDSRSFSALVTLSSLSAALRRLLCPLLWQEVLIHRPDRLGKLRSIMEYYQRLASSVSEIDRFLYPLPLVRCLKVIMPDRYLSLDQEILRHLFRSGMNPANGLHTLEWDAEVLPSPMIWRMLGTPEKPHGLEAMLAERKGRTMSREQIREIAIDADGSTMTMFHPRLGPRIPDTGNDLDTTINMLRLDSTERPNSGTTLLHDVDLIERGVFDELEDLDVFAVTPEFPLWIGLRKAGRRLKRLRLILDINSSFGNFDRLFRELAEGEAGESTNSAPGDLTAPHEAASSYPSCGAFPELVSLFVEPLPQENTAPSFPRFLDTCPKLRFLNGRRVDGLARTGSAEIFSFNPDQRSGAFFY
ncbi:hypothetical protein BCV69DRAFT_312636 [Microstroma glucosiphilum]|uniref:Uncharacterized protein n=1 Tax=Pseudomicrostroma glucosiphilum TaxID=1684307 RepID=A0A316U763_9BASI|nr:hypothetical protein BCV69DRAFT_312636 [Pseudomicrostroma glucosiphilum]PWN20684.1 hypothetical protein BCV69DRAFT_312636 [Pseudomicrostroma glucosiphilum]